MHIGLDLAKLFDVVVFGSLLGSGSDDVEHHPCG